MLYKGANVPPKQALLSSMEYCGCLFDEGNIRPGFSRGSGHEVMIPPLRHSSLLFLSSALIIPELYPTREKLR
jgi:hypothetical protein